MNRLKEIRMREYMLTQKDFAAMLEIRPNQYNRYEKDVNTPSVEIALRIAQKLYKTIEEAQEVRLKAEKELFEPIKKEAQNKILTRA